MKKIIAIPFFLLAYLSGNIYAGELHRLGLVWKDPCKSAPQHEIKIVKGAKGPLPAFVDHSADMPPVGNQGGQGSCTAWAAVYYHKSYQEWVEHGWSLADQNHLFSPSFVYNQINGGGDNGSWFGDAFQVLCDMGSSSLVLKPYYDGDCISWPSETAYDSAIAYRSEEWYWFSLYDSLGIEGVKQCLYDGNNVVIGLLVYSNYDNISSYNNTFCVSDLSGDIRGGHANCIVGYDDSLITSDGRGAFRVVNSWGTSWGDQGYYWMSYQAAIDARTSYQVAFYSSDKIDYHPTLKMHAKLNHANRGSVEINVGIGPTPSTRLWEKSFYQNPFDGYYFGGGNNPFPDNNIVLDLTQGAACLDSAINNNIYLRCIDDQVDGVSGYIQFLGVESLEWGVNGISRETPVVIADDYDYHYANVSLHYHDYSISSVPGEVMSGQGDTSYIKLNLRQINGFANPVHLHADVLPLPVSGDIEVGLDRSTLTPDDSCTIRLAVSSDVNPGRYTICITGLDSIDTLTHSSEVTLWVAGSGEAACIGSTSGLLQLARSRWSKVDSLELMPPAIGSNYSALILENNLSPADSSKVRGFIAGGGQVLSIGRSVHDLSGGSNLLSVSQWLGASVYAWYTGTGINVISNYQCPFGVPSIDNGDTLGILTANNGRLASLLPGSVSLAHLGTVTSAVAALYNEYGAGKNLWITTGAGFSPRVDSLITGYFKDPTLGVSTGQDPRPAVLDPKPSLEVRPNPFRQTSVISLNLPGKTKVKIIIYDICGRAVKTVFDGETPGGQHNFVWEASDQAGKRAASGVYFVRVETNYGNTVKKIISVR